MQVYLAITRQVQIRVKPTFLSEQSNPAVPEFIWAYQVEIENLGAVTVQLTARTWNITDKNGNTQIVHGPGVVGEQPILHQGDSFTYTSGCPLKTPSGIMSGSYTMVTEDGETFEAQVPVFSLDSHFDVRVVN